MSTGQFYQTHSMNGDKRLFVRVANRCFLHLETQRKQGILTLAGLMRYLGESPMPNHRPVTPLHRAAIQSTSDLRERIVLPKAGWLQILSTCLQQVRRIPRSEVAMAIFCLVWSIWYGWVLGGMR
jgi:hypothetical protein